MRKFTTSFALVCTVAAAAFLGACSKNADSNCSEAACCKDKAAAVKTDSQATPAATAGSCSKSCSGEKKTCPMTGQSN